jgi:hypothetical protein
MQHFVDTCAFAASGPALGAATSTKNRGLVCRRRANPRMFVPKCLPVPYEAVRPRRAVDASCCAVETAHRGSSTHAGEGLVRPGRGRVCGGLGVEFLAVAGGLGTVIALASVPAAAFLMRVTSWTSPRWLAFTAVAVVSFASGIVLSRFDLHKLRKLRLTIVFMMCTRLLCGSMLANFVSLASTLFSSSLQQATILPVVPPLLDAASHAAVSLGPAHRPFYMPFFLLSLAPMGYSPSVAMLSPYMYPTLYAHLTLLTALLFPVMLMIPYALSLVAHAVLLPGVGIAISAQSVPVTGLLLLATTTLPAVVALTFSRLLSRRYIAMAGLCALPCAWISSAFLMASAMCSVTAGDIVGLGGSLVACGSITLLMGLLGRALGAALHLDVRAKRTLILYLCSQGATAAAGLVPRSGAIAPTVASAITGLIAAYVLSKRWSKVVVRTSIDNF